MNTIATLGLVILAAMTLTGTVFAFSLLPEGDRTFSSLENIDGIPYSNIGGTTHVAEQLAHADVFVNQPVLGQDLVLTVTFTPHDLAALHVGVRANSFWLSYQPVILYQDATQSDASLTERITKTIVIPLTDKLQEPDQSIDLMFFGLPRQLGDRSLGTKASVSAGGQVDIPAIAGWMKNRSVDTAYWELHDIQTKVDNTSLFGWRNHLRLIDYIFSLIRRERAL